MEYFEAWEHPLAKLFIDNLKRNPKLSDIVFHTCENLIDLAIEHDNKSLFYQNALNLYINGNFSSEKEWMKVLSQQVIVAKDAAKKARSRFPSLNVQIDYHSPITPWKYMVEHSSSILYQSLFYLDTDDQDQPILSSRVTFQAHVADYGKYLIYECVCENGWEKSYPCFPIDDFLELVRDGETEDIEDEKYLRNIVHDNAMTRGMLYYLSLDDRELQSHIGHRAPGSYRLSILISLNALQD